MVWRAITKSKLFDLKNRYEFIPIIAATSAVCAGAAAAMVYFLFTKMDVQINRKTPERFEGVDLLRPSSQKLMTINQKYEPMPELHKLLTEIKEGEEKQNIK